jgi:Uma2 family endonuclease
MTAIPHHIALARKEKLKTFVSLEKYFQAEEKALCKSEYHNGKIIKMAGGSYNHDSIAIKCTHLMLEFVEKNDLLYAINGSDLKIRIEAHDRVLYADALVISEKPIFYENRTDTITNPIIIVEVLSKSTAQYDISEKFDFYRTLESFKEYVLVHQDRKHVIVFTKQTDNTWNLCDYIGEEAVALLHALQDCPLALKRLYKGLDMP